MCIRDSLYTRRPANALNDATRSTHTQAHSRTHDASIAPPTARDWRQSVVSPAGWVSDGASEIKKNIVLWHLEYAIHGSRLKKTRPTVFSRAARRSVGARRHTTATTRRLGSNARRCTIAYARATHRTHLERETRLKTGETRTRNPRISRARDLPLENNRSIDRSARDWTRETNEGKSGFRETTVRSLR